MQLAIQSPFDSGIPSSLPLAFHSSGLRQTVRRWRTGSDILAKLLMNFWHDKPCPKTARSCRFTSLFPDGCGPDTLPTGGEGFRPSRSKCDRRASTSSANCFTLAVFIEETPSSQFMENVLDHWGLQTRSSTSPFICRAACASWRPTQQNLQVGRLRHATLRGIVEASRGQDHLDDEPNDANPRRTA